MFSRQATTNPEKDSKLPQKTAQASRENDGGQRVGFQTSQTPIGISADNDGPRIFPENPAARIRRFHMSKIARVVNDTEIDNNARRRSSRAQTAVFVERKGRLRTAAEAIRSEAQAPHDLSVPGSEQARPQKKPGQASRTQALPTSLVSKNGSPATFIKSERNVKLPSGLVKPWTVSSEKLAAEMQAFTLQEIGKNIAEAEASKPIVRPTNDHRSKHSQVRFKPKKPALRYSERHPTERSDIPTEMDLEDQFTEDDSIDDSNYIIETYVRVPADAVESCDIQRNFGLLVLDSQPEIDEFYLDSSDSELEDEIDEEDENGTLQLDESQSSVLADDL